MAAPSAQARRTLQDAFERFASGVTPDDRRLFHNTQLKDVRDEAIRIERQLRARRMQKNMARLDPFLRGMEHYSKVVEVLCNGTPYLAWIWAPVKLMLMITVDSISAFEKLIEAYGKIADMLPRLDRLGNALASDHNFQSILALVYSDIVEFHRRAYKFVRRKSWAIFFSSMWAGFESRFNGILENLAYHSKLADKEAAAADIAEAIRRSKADDEQWEQQEREWTATKVQRVLTWLGANDTLPSDTLERHIRGCLPGSCDWFVQHKATQLWLRDSAKNPLLWLCGKPGSGKSVICSSFVQHAEANALHMFYYFCSYLGSYSDGPNRLLQSIISQVIQKHQDLAIYVHDVYFKSHPVPTKKALLSLLPELLRGLGSVRLVVDGVDEWTPKDQKELLKDLSQMISTDQSSHVCKIMIASQDTMDISRSLRKKDKSATTISLSNGDERLAVNSSIANFVDSKLSDLPDHLDELDPDASILNHIKQTLLHKSHGMFLWVSLVLESLDTVYSPEELRTIVDDLPSDLEDLYERILVRLCSAPGAQSHGGVSRIMSWVCFARRPLHKSELLHALSILPRDESAQVRSIPVASILDHCKPLIEELPDSTIVPVHFSVKKYFLKSRIPQIVPAIDAALDISSACAIVITRGLDLTRFEHSSTDHLIQTASGKYRLLPYALEFWIEHCSQYASGGGSLSLDQPIQRHLAQMHKKHTDCLHALGHAAIQVGTQDANDTNHIDKRLERFSNMPIYGLMVDVLSLRRLVSQLDGDKSSDIEKYIASNDRTLFSKLAHRYESAVVHLLGQHEIRGIQSATLRAFQNSYASTAFRCRFPHCNRLSLGFATAELRLEHETVHIQRVYCQTVSCQYSRIGFARKSALNAHTRKHHDQANILPIPARVRRTTGAQAEIGTKSHESRNIDVEPQQPDPQQLAAGPSPLRINSQQEQWIIKQFAKRLMDTCKKEVRAKFEADVRTWPEDKKQQLLSHGIDPLFLRFCQHAEVSLQQKGVLNSQLASQNAAGEETTGMQNTSQQNPMQGQQTNINQLELSQEFDFDEIARRQIEAIRSQDQGATVVPASNNSHNSGQIGSSQDQDAQPIESEDTVDLEDWQRHLIALEYQEKERLLLGRREQHRDEEQKRVDQDIGRVIQAIASKSSHLEDYQLQLLLLELQNKKRSLMAEQEEDNTQEQLGQPDETMEFLDYEHIRQLQVLEELNKKRLMTRQGRDSVQEQPSQPEKPLASFDREYERKMQALTALNKRPLQAKHADATARLSQPERMRMLPPGIDDVVKQQLLKVPEHQFRGIIKRYHAGKTSQDNDMPDSTLSPGQTNGIQPEPVFNQGSPFQPGVPDQTRPTASTEAETGNKALDFRNTGFELEQRGSSVSRTGFGLASASPDVLREYYPQGTLHDGSRSMQPPSSYSMDSEVFSWFADFYPDLPNLELGSNSSSNLDLDRSSGYGSFVPIEDDH